MPVGELLGEQVAEAQDKLTFEELLSREDPPNALLKELKTFGNYRSQQESDLLPVDVAMAIYLAAIAAGLVRLRENISQSPPEVISVGLQWMRTSPWLDSGTRQLVALARAALATQTSDRGN